MLERILNGYTDQLLERALDAASLRQRVLADNLANVDTPGFKRSDVAFASLVKAQMASQEEAGTRLQLVRTNPLHLPAPPPAPALPRPVVVQDLQTAYRPDGNNVDIDREMASEAENALLYQALVQRVNGRLSLLGEAMK